MISFAIFARIFYYYHFIFIVYFMYIYSCARVCVRVPMCALVVDQVWRSEGNVF